METLSRFDMRPGSGRLGSGTVPIGSLPREGVSKGGTRLLRTSLQSV